MKTFFLITNKHRDEDLSITHLIIDYIKGKGGICHNYVSTKSNWNERQLLSLEKEKLNVDCVIVLGGDGTLVRAARDLSHLNIPVIGINLGTLGYLCELELADYQHAIDQIFDDDYMIESRMMLEGMSHNSRAMDALNDIVIHRSGNTQIMRICISVDGEHLNTYIADGIIVSTPTGSTGYSLSSGGPIVDPVADMILITPINCHDLNSRSIVVGADANIEIALVERRMERDEIAEVSVDGDHMVQLHIGDRIRIRRAKDHVKILKLNKLSFYQMLREKMSDHH